MFSRRKIRKDDRVLSSSAQREQPVKRKVRSEVLSSGFWAALQSALAGFIFVLVVSTAVAVVSGHFFLILLPVLILAVRWKRLAFEIFLTMHVIESALDTFAWYSLVDNDLYLGAIPLQDQHLELFFGKLRIGTVLSLNEDFELNASTIVGSPVTSADWKRCDINFLQLPTPDFMPLSFALLDTGADFLNSELTEGRKVYCHCKSGIGRSASVVMAYFIKYRGMDCDAAYDELLSKRSVIFKKNSRQAQRVREYAAWLQQSK